MGESVVPTPEETAVVKSFDETIVTNIGQPIKRKEDQRLLTGAGRFTDDFTMPNQSFASMVRSPYPHALINGIDANKALSMPGVLAVITSADIQKALKSAQMGLEVWKNTSPWERSRIIRKISELMRKRVDVLAKWLTLEVGKPITEGPGEVGGAADIFEWNSEETKRIFGEINQSRFTNTRIHVIYQPVGVVAALVPWNFPVILASRKISTALAAGCSVICKPDVITPGTVMELVDICREAGVPPGVVNLLSGDPPSISNELLESDIVKKVSITGSTRVGKLILKKAADKVQRVTMELSGHSPFIVSVSYTHLTLPTSDLV